MATGELATGLVPILLDGFAAGMEAEAILTDETGAEVADESEILSSPGSSSRFGVRFSDYDGETLAEFAIEGLTQEEGFGRLASGEAALVVTDRQVPRASRIAVEAAGGGDLRTDALEQVIAVDGFAVVGHPDNSISAISVAQAARIMAGQITNWSEVGGPDAPMNVYTLSPDAEDFAEIHRLLLEPSGYDLSPDATVMDSARELTSTLMRDPAGIGIVSYSNKRGTRPLPLINECGMVVETNPFTIKTEEYPLGHRVYAYNRADIDGYAKDFLAYLDGPDLDGLVSKAGYIDLSVTADVQVEAEIRLTDEIAENDNLFEQEIMRELQTALNTYERLSTTFRFGTGSKRLDVKAQRDLGRMIDYIAENKPQELIIVGFTDNKGAFEPNLSVSIQRAERVLEAMRDMATGGELDGVEISARGYGELSPVACNSNRHGRAVNRRVEVWVR